MPDARPSFGSEPFILLYSVLLSVFHSFFFFFSFPKQAQRLVSRAAPRLLGALGAGAFLILRISQAQETNEIRQIRLVERRRNLRQTMNLKRNIFVGGKGGVGKSTLSASLALALSRRGKILLVSTDPAHNLGDLLGGGESGEIFAARDNLDAVEIDPEKETREYADRLAAHAREHVSPSSYQRVDDYFASARDSASAQESALFERLSSLMVESRERGYDRVVIDTAPTGHTLRLFFMPGALKRWSRGLLEAQGEASFADDVIGHVSAERSDGEDKRSRRAKLLDLLNNRYRKYARCENIMRDDSDVMLVLNPENLPVLETRRSAEYLRERGKPVTALFVNKVLPDSKDEFLAAHKALQERFIAQIETSFPDTPKAWVPYAKNELKEDRDLEAIGESLLKQLGVD